MLFANIGVLDANFQFQTQCYVQVQKDKIVYMGKTMPPNYQGEVYDGTGKLLMPGLVNAHGHAPMTLLRGYAENLSLQDWLHKKVFPFEDQMTERDIYNGSMLAFAEQLRFGVTSTSEMYFMGEAMAKAVLDSGIRCNLSVSVTCFDDRNLSELPIAKEMDYLLHTYHNAEQGRLKLDLSIHAEYTSTPKIVAQMAEYAKKTGLINHIHLSETQSENEGCIERHGKTPTEYFLTQGVLDTPVLAAHCVYLTDEDRAILAEKNATVVTCPQSNLKLASGFAHVVAMQKAHIPVALGTDGAASNNSLNLWNELRLVASLAKAVEEDPTAVSPLEALQMATKGGAIAQGRNDIGTVQVGQKADLIVVDLQNPWLKPLHNLENQLVYACQGNEVVLTMVDGKVLYRDGVYPHMDVEKIMAEAEASTTTILQKVNNSK